MRELGYAPSSLSARQIGNGMRVSVILSAGTNPFFDALRVGFETASHAPIFGGVKFDFSGFDAYDPTTLCANLDAVDDDTSAVIMVGVDNAEVTKCVNRLIDRGIRVISVVSDIPQSRRFAYVGQDNFAAGRAAARLMAGFIPPGPGQVALLLGHLEFRHLLDRASGFRQVLGMTRPDLTLVQPAAYGNNPDHARAILANMAEMGEGLKGVYLAGGGQPTIIEGLATVNPGRISVIGHEVNAQSRSALSRGDFTAILAHNTVEMGHTAMGVALGQISPNEGQCPIYIYVEDNLPPG